MMNSEVTHNIAAHRFEWGSEAALAICEYSEVAGVWVFTHTYVPDSLRGNGIASLLLKAALTAARNSGKRIVPECSFVSAFVQRHPEYQDLLPQR